jgi:hypothetical protein
MKKNVKYAILTLVLSLGASTLAHARPESRWDSHSSDSVRFEDRHAADSDPIAPEVDPALAIGGFSLLAGGLTILRARRSK